MARITLTADRVTWSDFENPRRPAWNFEEFGSFVFDRGAYEKELDQPVDEELRAFFRNWIEGRRGFPDDPSRPWERKPRDAP